MAAKNGNTSGSAMAARTQKDAKSARRIMAEKCIEKLLSLGCISKTELLNMISGPQKELVEALVGPSSRKTMSKFEEYFG